VLFANFSEALAEGRGKAQAEALRRTRKETNAKRISRLPTNGERPGNYSMTPSFALRQGDLFLVEAGEIMPADGEIVVGIASVDESAVTGESAPVIRESGGDRSAVTGGTRLLSDWLVVKVSANPGEGFLDRMISLVEGASARRPLTKLHWAFYWFLLQLFFWSFVLPCCHFHFTVSRQQVKVLPLQSQCW